MAVSCSSAAGIARIATGKQSRGQDATRGNREENYDTEIAQVLIAAMRKSPELIKSALCLLRAVRYLERIADHAANIAEDAVYLVEGEIIRHHPEAIKETDASQSR